MLTATSIYHECITTLSTSPLTSLSACLFRRGRLLHGRHFTYKSINGDTAITFVSTGVEGAFATEEHPYAAHGPWLQVTFPEFLYSTPASCVFRDPVSEAFTLVPHPVPHLTGNMEEMMISHVGFCIISAALLWLAGRGVVKRWVGRQRSLRVHGILPSYCPLGFGSRAQGY